MRHIHLGIAMSLFESEEKRLMETSTLSKRNACVLVCLLLAIVAAALPATGQEILWIKYAGTAAHDRAWGIAINGSAMYVVGETSRAFEGEPPPTGG
jgi:hypothetical protein